MALTTLITPVFVLLGSLLNHEDVGLSVWVGTAVIMGGLAIFFWGHRLRPARLLL